MPIEKSFVDKALAYSRTPLGIIALFIVLVYLLASLVVMLGKSRGLTDQHIFLLVCFLISFPYLIFIGFWHLIYKRASNLIFPQSYNDEAHYNEAKKVDALIEVLKAYEEKGQDISPALVEQLLDSLPINITHNSDMKKSASLLWVLNDMNEAVHERSSYQKRDVVCVVETDFDRALANLNRRQFNAVVVIKRVSEENKIQFDKIKQATGNAPLIAYQNDNSLDCFDKVFEMPGELIEFVQGYF